ncbi:MAG: hypothetical protein JWP78_901 [Mucilaginibacter sp.]|nr:hypothetical protein [Mucilaginibacter sp.]
MLGQRAPFNSVFDKGNNEDVLKKAEKIPMASTSKSSPKFTGCPALFDQ